MVRALALANPRKGSCDYSATGATTVTFAREAALRGRAKHSRADSPTQRSPRRTYS
jgi:hypothetical protein